MLGDSLNLSFFVQPQSLNSCGVGGREGGGEEGRREGGQGDYMQPFSSVFADLQLNGFEQWQINKCHLGLHSGAEMEV